MTAGPDLLEVGSLVLWQEPGSIVRRRARLRVRVSSGELTLLRRDGAVLRRIPLDSIRRVDVVSALRMRKASYRPFRGSVLRLEVIEPGGLLVLGIVLRAPEPWRARLSGNPVTPPS